jgi:hypothetical protein
MDRKLQNQEIQRLIRLGESARSGIQRETLVLRQRLDLASRIRGTIKNHPTGWILGAMGTGLTISRLLFRSRRQKPTPAATRKSLPMVALGLTLTAIRPFAKVWLADQVKRYLAGQLATTGRRPSLQASNQNIP